MMIQPVQSGAELLADIENTHPQPRQVAIWWLGQSGYAIKTASTLFFVDLYLSEHLTAKYAQTEKPHIRMTTAPIRGHELPHVDLIFASHKHSDHLDPVTIPEIFKNSPSAKLVLPQAIVDHALSLGLPREKLMPLRGDETDTGLKPLVNSELVVHAIPSAHPEFDYTPEQGYPFLGFVFQVDGLTLYHSGDTLAYDGLAARLQAFQPDIVFLPINGTDERRTQLHVPPNMNMQDAIKLAKEVNARLLIPHHYDMFTFNTVDVRDFTLMATEAMQPYRVLRCGEKFCWSH